LLPKQLQQKSTSAMEVTRYLPSNMKSRFVHNALLNTIIRKVIVN